MAVEYRASVRRRDFVTASACLTKEENLRGRIRDLRAAGLMERLNAKAIQSESRFTYHWRADHEKGKCHAVPCLP